MFMVVCCDDGRRVIVLAVFFGGHFIERPEIENFPLFSGFLHHFDRAAVINNIVIVNLSHFVTNKCIEPHLNHG